MSTCIHGHDKDAERVRLFRPRKSRVKRRRPNICTACLREAVDLGRRIGKYARSGNGSAVSHEGEIE